MEQFNPLMYDLLKSFATELSKHKLKKDMTCDEILALIIPEELPEGLSKKNADIILNLYKKGVPDKHFIHTQKLKLFVPTKHEQLYKNEKYKIAGPLKDKLVIKWLAKKASML